MEYEVDELRRDLALSRIANKEGKALCTFVHDKCIVAPGDVMTKDGRGYTVSIPISVFYARRLMSQGLLTLPSYVETGSRPSDRESHRTSGRTRSKRLFSPLSCCIWEIV